MPLIDQLILSPSLQRIRELLFIRPECTPRILVVSDSLSYRADDGFGLSEFVAALRAGSVHGMTPIVRTAFRGDDPSAGADLNNFEFVTGLQQTYDVLFLFGFASASKADPGVGGNLPQPEVDAITAFMAAGKGVFATGDHASLGAAMCGNLPRIGSMRRWFTEDGAPSATAATRITTNDPGDDGVFEFVDQSDAIPQKIYPRHYQTAAGVSRPHALLQAPSSAAQGWLPIEVAPDHPHEGECVDPSAFPAAEWPSGASGQVRPEVIAYGMTYGGAFPGKDAVLQPRAFGVIGAYDGHGAGVGRIAVDSTWHHFININIDGTGTARAALKPGGVPSPALQRIHTYWHNLASWLMPARVRRCLLIARVADLLQRYPLREELVPVPWPPPGPDPVPDLGRQVLAAARGVMTPAELATFTADLRALALGREVATATRTTDEAVVGTVAAWLAADGLAPRALAERMGEPHDLGKRLPRTLAGPLKAALGHQRAALARLHKDLDGLVEALTPT